MWVRSPPRASTYAADNSSQFPGDSGVAAVFRQIGSFASTSSYAASLPAASRRSRSSVML